ncbi:F-box/FBD/LRR-repeat protein At3g26920 [Aegilops tauschii subsp. strangulata]|nr:F-box/FBD/LRR-repeat protein At3g26920 [Aegilops tauschii subsp. strangulata]
MDARRRSPKKRKFERVPDQDSPPGSGSAGVDLINALPDAVLCTIVSLLPTKDGARTQAIARRWRPLWRSAPLNLVADSTLSRQQRKRVVYVTKILAEHPGPALRLNLPYIRRRDYGKIDGWLRSQALTDLQELHLGYDSQDSPPPSLLSPSALRFAPTLRVATFTDCHFPDLSAQSLNFSHLQQLGLYGVTFSALSAHYLNFPRLKQLTMSVVTILEDALHNMLSGCLSLESLLLEDNVGFARLRISSLTLRSIGFSAPYTQGPSLFHELVIEDAPCLERLLPLSPDYGPTIVRVIRAPKLQVLGVLSKGISKLHIGTTVFQEMTAISLTTTMRTVKVLVIESFGPNLDAVIGFLKCFPCLERLYVLSQPWMEMKNVQKYDPLDPIECLESYLKRVVWKNYIGDMLDVEFAKFFVLNAKVLEEMKFVSSNSCDRQWKSNQHMCLQVDSRASPDARLEFISCMDVLGDDKRTHDLSMADPFE